MRKPVQHKIFHKRNRGLTNCLVDNLPVTELLQTTEIDNLLLLTSGPIPPNPSELLASGRFQAILEELKKEADMVIIDCPPVIAVIDACVIAGKVDGVILVLAAGMVRPDMAKQAHELLKRANGQVLGVILNRVEIQAEHAYYYYGHEKSAN